MKHSKGEVTVAVYATVFIFSSFVLAIFIFSLMEDRSPQEEEFRLVGFPYHLPLLDISISEDFSPWARRTGLQRPPDTFLHHIEFRIDLERNWVHTKIGVTSPRYVELEQVTLTLHRLPTVWPNMSRDVVALQEGRTYFRFFTPIEIFRSDGIDLIQWHLQEEELLIFEARIERG